MRNRPTRALEHSIKKTFWKKVFLNSKIGLTQKETSGQIFLELQDLVFVQKHLE